MPGADGFKNMENFVPDAEVVETDGAPVDAVTPDQIKKILSQIEGA
jgi:hypothetical protein